MEEIESIGEALDQLAELLSSLALDLHDISGRTTRLSLLVRQMAEKENRS